MSADKQTPANVEATGLLAGVTGMFKNAICLFLSYLELAGTELSGLLSALLHLCATFGLALLAAGLALAWGSGLIVLIFWERMGSAIVLIVCACFTLLAVILGFYCSVLLRRTRSLIPMTMAELRIDRDLLKSLRKNVSNE